MPVIKLLSSDASEVLGGLSVNGKPIVVGASDEKH
jgi:hypothetical protein